MEFDDSEFMFHFLEQILTGYNYDEIFKIYDIRIATHPTDVCTKQYGVLTPLPSSVKYCISIQCPSRVHVILFQSFSTMPVSRCPGRCRVIQGRSGGLKGRYAGPTIRRERRGGAPKTALPLSSVVDTN